MRAIFAKAPGPKTMVFVDGENFTTRLREVSELAAPFNSPTATVFVRDAVAWSQACTDIFQASPSQLVRISYYTAIKGDDLKIEEARKGLQLSGIGHTYVSKKTENKSKAVDTQLTADLVEAAASKACDEIVLVAMDADYIPAVEQAKRKGVRVFLSFPGLELINPWPSFPPWPLFPPGDLARSMGMAKSADYTLAFDGIRQQDKWFRFELLDAEQMHHLFYEHILPVICDHLQGPVCCAVANVSATLNSGTTVSFQRNGEIYVDTPGVSGTSAPFLLSLSSVRQRLADVIADREGRRSDRTG